MNEPQETLKWCDDLVEKLDKEREAKWARQEHNALKLLSYYKNLFQKENAILFDYAITVKIPYWIHWVKKYKWIAPSIISYLNDIWKIYAFLKYRKETENLTRLF